MVGCPDDRAVRVGLLNLGAQELAGLLLKENRRLLDAGCVDCEVRMGKLSRLTPVLIDERMEVSNGAWWLDFCERIAEGAALHEVAKSEGMTYGALMRWIQADPDRVTALQLAQAMHAQKMVDESLAIADEMTPEEAFKAKLRIDTRLRIAGKLDQRFGNGPQIGISGNNIQVVLTNYTPPSENVLDADEVKE